MADKNYAFTWLKNKSDEKWTEFRAGLESLTGNDFEAAERAEHAAGNNAPLLTLSKGYQSRLAAKALKVPAPVIKGLPLKDYIILTNEVQNFLFSGSGELESESSIEE